MHVAVESAGVIFSPRELINPHKLFSQKRPEPSEKALASSSVGGMTHSPSPYKYPYLSLVALAAQIQPPLASASKGNTRCRRSCGYIARSSFMRRSSILVVKGR